MNLQAKLSGFLLILSTIVLGFVLTIALSYPIEQGGPMCRFYANGNEIPAADLASLVKNVNAVLPQEIAFSVTKGGKTADVKIALADLGASYIAPEMVSELESYFNTTPITSFLQKIENDRLALMSYVFPQAAAVKSFSFSVETLNVDKAKLTSKINEQLKSALSITDDADLSAVTNYIVSNLQLGKLTELSLAL